MTLAQLLVTAGGIGLIAALARCFTRPGAEATPAPTVARKATDKVGS